MKKHYVYCVYYKSLVSDLMSKTNLHIVRHKALLILTLTNVPYSHRFIRRAFNSLRANIRVYDCMLARIVTRLFKKHESISLHDSIPCNADNLQHGLHTDLSVIESRAYRGALSVYAID